MTDKKLISDVIERLGTQQHISQVGTKVLTPEQIRQQSIIQQNEETLVVISRTKFNDVLSALVEHLYEQPGRGVTEETQVQLLDILCKCMAAEWEKMKPTHCVLLPRTDTQAAPVARALDEPLARKILDLVYGYLLKPPQFKVEELNTHFLEISRKIIYYVSGLHSDSTFPKISNIIHSGATLKESDDLVKQYQIIAHLNLNSKRLSDLLDSTNKSIGSYAKKTNHQVLLAKVLRSAIWNWIANYPLEFVQLCKTNQRLPGRPEILFDQFHEWSSSSKLRSTMWPVQTALLLLCPDILVKIQSKDKSEEAQSKEKFLEELKKPGKSGKLPDPSTICFIDLLKAATYVDKSETSSSPLLQIYPTIDKELRDKLFDPKVAAKSDEDFGHQDLTVDYLVASFRLSPEKAQTSLFPECLKPDGLATFKMALIRALLIIAKEGAKLPWSPRLRDAYGSLGPSIRGLFQECVRSAKQYDAFDKADKKAKQQQEKLQPDVDLLEKVIELFHVEPELPLHSMGTVAEDLDASGGLLNGLCECVSLFSLPRVADHGSEALLEFHKTDKIEKWCVKNIIGGFWDISSQVTVTLANVLIERQDIKPIHALKLLTLLEAILSRRNEFLRNHQNNAVPTKLSDVRVRCSTKLECALLMHLCSGEASICSKAASCFGLLCDEIDVLGGDQTDNAIYANHQVYRKLAASGVLGTGVQLGRVAQQLAIRRLLRKIERQTAGNFGAWNEIYDRWSVYTQYVLNNAEEPTNDPNAALLKKKSTKELIPPKILQDKASSEIQEEWKNYTGFLVALSGICINKETLVKVTDPKNKSKSPAEKTVKVLDSFLSELLDYLTTQDSKYVRETVMSLTGSSISHTVYPVLLQHLHNEVRSYFGAAGQISISKKSTMFVDQSISVLKHILEVQQESDNLSLLADFEVVLETFVKYISQLIVDETSIRIKKTTCQLVGAMMAKRQYISFRNEMKFRNDLVEHIMEWTSDFAVQGQLNDTPNGTTANAPSALSRAPTLRSSPSTSNMTSSPTQTDLKQLFTDLDIEAMKSIASLLRGLPVQESESNMESSIGGDRSKTKFVKYFTFFTKLLSRCKEESKDAKKTERVTLAECTIQCLSNLLAANIDSGLQFFVTMGYHEDFATRTAFLKVLRNILSQGAEFDQQSEGDKYDKLLELLFESDLALVLALCESVQLTEADEVAALLIRLFETNDRTMGLLKAAIQAEVARTSSSNDLFRRNSMSTKLLAAYSKINGRQYLRDTLLPIIQGIISNPATYEIDPQKLPNGENIETNLDNIRRISEQFLQAVAKSLEHCPVQFREICSILFKAVGERFPGNEHAAVGGFLFLRFICPAIVSPEGFGIIKELPNQDLRRPLILTTKVLQNLANGVQFQKDKKEPFMTNLNSFIESNLKLMRDVLDKFASLPSDAQQQQPTPVITDEQRDADLGQLHHYLTMYLEKVARNLQSTNEQRLTFDRLTSVLRKLGQPPEPSVKQLEQFRANVTAANKGDSSLYDAFMKTKATLNTDKIKEKNVFYKHGNTKDKKPVFYLIARRYSNTDSEIEMDPLLYYILKTTQSSISKPFVLVIDCTLFSLQNEMPQSWCSYFLKHFPAIGDNLDAIFFVNANHEFKKYSKTLRKLLTRSVLKKLFFLPSALKLADYIPEAEIGLPADTVAVEKDVKSSFSPVLKISEFSQKEMVLRVSSDYLQLLTMKLHPILGKVSPLIDLLHVSRITEILHVAEEHEFIVKYHTSNVFETNSLVLRSPAAKQIIERLNASKNLHKLTKNTGVGRTLRNPSDVPGTLLNMALLNLGTDNDALRLAAYNMLDALCTNFHFVVQLQLLGTDGLCIPPHSFHFIVNLSERLALTQPDLTLEFLTECIQGLSMSKATPQLKHLCLDYMRPWFTNLSKFCHVTSDPDSAEKVSKTKQIIYSLLDLTVREASIVTIILSTVWETIGKVADILETVVDCCIAQGIKNGPSSALEVIGSVVATIASQNPQLVSGKIIARLLNMINLTTNSNIMTLDSHESWPAITVVLRLLFMLSFENLIHVQQYLPELFHLIMVLFATGSSDVRATTHGLLVNVIHSLYTIKVTFEDKLQSLSFHLSESNQPKFKLLFGIGGQNVTAFSKPNPSEKPPDKCALPTVETVATALFSVLSAVSPLNNPIGTTWHARWLSLTVRAAFTPNLAVQPRACVTLGVLCKSVSLVTDDLLELVMVALKEALRTTTHNGDDDLAVSLIVCLTHLYEFLSPSSPYFKVMLWVAMSLVQISDPKVFNAAISLMGTVLKVQDFHEFFDKGIEVFQINAREGAIEQILAKLDQMSGLSFKSSFSFGIAGHLLKGLKHPRTKENTSRVLSSFLDISIKTAIGTNIVGYLAALLPVEGELPIIRDIGLPSGDRLYQCFFNEQLLPDAKHAALLFTFLVTILQNTEKEHEQLFIYEALKEGANYMPDAFCVVEEILFPMMSEVLLKTQIPHLMESVHSIMQSIYTFKEVTKQKLTRTFLNEIGYHKLPECATFDIEPEMKREITKLVILLLENLLKEVQEKA